MSQKRLYSQIQISPSFCFRNCPWRLTVQLNSQLESSQETIPPVTTFPERGSRLQILVIASMIFVSLVVIVADSQRVLLTFPQNFSGWPKEGSCFAIFFQRFQHPVIRIIASPFAGVWWSPYSVLSVQLPFVTKTRSSFVSGSIFVLEFLIYSILFATFWSFSNEKITFVTCVWKWKITPFCFRYSIIGKIKDSYWLYRVNFKAEKSGNPPIWWINRCRYNFSSKALCQFSKANIVRQYNQKSESKTCSSKTSSIVLSYNFSFAVKNNFMICFRPLASILNLPKFSEGFPRWFVARHKE